MDPVIHAEMTNLVMEEKQLQRELEKIGGDLPTWEKRVQLASNKGMHDLAEQARDKVHEMRERKGEITTRLDMIAEEKSMLRVRSRRPSGDATLRAEMLVEHAKLGGLDPDAAKAERELDELAKDDDLEDFTFDFNESSDS